jgi:hypothetical protein
MQRDDETAKHAKYAKTKALEAHGCGDALPVSYREMLLTEPPSFNKWQASLKRWNK